MSGEKDSQIHIGPTVQLGEKGPIVGIVAGGGSSEEVRDHVSREMTARTGEPHETLLISDAIKPGSPDAESRGGRGRGVIFAWPTDAPWPPASPNLRPRGDQRRPAR